MMVMFSSYTGWLWMLLSGDFIQKFRQIIRIYIQCLIQNSEIMIFPCCLEQIRHTLYWQMIAKIYRLELQLEREKRGHSIGSLLHSLSMVTSAQNHWNWQNRNRCYWALIFGSLCSASINYTDDLCFIHYSTVGSGATRTCTGMGFAGLASVSHCPVLKLTLSFSCVLIALLSFSFWLTSH